MGNPASIFILDEREEFNRNEMSKIGMEENMPICCFIKRKMDRNTEKDSSIPSFDICYYNLDGSQAYMCGHGTLASTDIILNRILNGAGKIQFYFDTTPFNTKIRDNRILASRDEDGKIFMEQKLNHYNILDTFDNDMEMLTLFLSLSKGDVKEIFRSVELNDLVFVLNNNKLLRSLKPNFREMVEILDRLTVRNLCVTAPSSSHTFDFETRVFIPHDNLDEDIVCGSSNLSIAKYWSYHMNKNSFKILFPYHMELEDGMVGGVQFVEVGSDRIRIGGYCDECEE